MGTIPNLPDLKRRLAALENQKALYGISVEASIIIEAEKLDLVISQMKLIEIHRQALATLLQQRAHFGANTPAHVISDIKNRRTEIVRLRAVCAKNGYFVEEHQVDKDLPQVEVEPHTLIPPHPGLISTILQQLALIESAICDDRPGMAIRLINELKALLK